MSLKILADESLDYRIVKKLRIEGFEVISVMEKYRSLADKDILTPAIKDKFVLVTEDSDFGEWVFAHQEKGVSVIFLRYKAEQIEKIIYSLLKLLSSYKETLYGKFVVITVQKVRMREIF